MKYEYFFRICECRNFSNVAHSVVIKTPRQLVNAQRKDQTHEQLHLEIHGCELKQGSILKQY